MAQWIQRFKLYFHLNQTKYCSEMRWMLTIGLNPPPLTLQFGRKNVLQFWVYGIFF